MMFILLTPDFKPNLGGIAEYLHQLCIQLAEHGDTHVFTSVPFDPEPYMPAYVLHPLPRLPALLTESIQTITPQQAALHFLQLKRYAQQTLLTTIQPYLSSHSEVFIGVWQPATHFWCEALRNANIPYSIFTYGLELLYPQSDRIQQWRQEDLRRARRIYACSHQTANLVQDSFQPSQSIYAVTPGATLKSDPSAIIASSATITRDLELQQAKILLTVGRLVPRKGFDLVIQCLPQLRQSFPNIRYLIAGDGEDKDRLMHLTESLGLHQTVTFLGRVDDITKEALYSLCDLFVMPNRLLDGKDWEGFGIVFLEAGLMSKPCIGGNNGGAIEAIIDGETGLLVDTSNHLETYQAIKQLLQDPDLGKQLGTTAKTRALAQFSWQASGQRLLQTLSA